MNKPKKLPVSTFNQSVKHSQRINLSLEFPQPSTEISILLTSSKKVIGTAILSISGVKWFPVNAKKKLNGSVNEVSWRIVKMLQDKGIFSK